jgi:hypothetical protein
MLGEEGESAGMILVGVARAMVASGRADELRQTLAECQSEEDEIGEYGRKLLAAVDSMLSEASGD